MGHWRVLLCGYTGYARHRSVPLLTWGSRHHGTV